jgi:hypothetical protein
MVPCLILETIFLSTSTKQGRENKVDELGTCNSNKSQIVMQYSSVKPVDHRIEAHQSVVRTAMAFGHTRPRRANLQASFRSCAT